MMTDPDILRPFSCQYSENMPALLQELNCTIALTTYQAGKLVFFSAHEPNGLIQLPRDFLKAMGLAVDDRRIAVATKQEVVILADASGLAPNYAGKGYDALYLPRSVLYTGELDLHDMAWGSKGLYAVNTRFSCLSLLNDSYSFEPIWKPPFIKDFVPDDLCHLNGLAMERMVPRFVTMLGHTSTQKGWRENVLSGGLIMDVQTNEVVCSELSMPHSPRINDGKLYCLLSATGEFVEVDVEAGTYEVISKVNGFARGMCFKDEYVFIGVSMIRKNSSTFRDLPIAGKAEASGVEVIHWPTGKTTGFIRYQSSVEEIYDIKILNGRKRPGILNHMNEDHRRALNTPQMDFWSD